MLRAAGFATQAVDGGEDWLGSASAEGWVGMGGLPQACLNIILSPWLPLPDLPA